MTRVRTGEQALLISVSVVLILALYYVSIGFASNILNLVGVLILGVASFLILKSRGGWVFLLYSFGLTFALSSGALIELTGAYLIEIQKIAYLTGAAARNAFLATFFLIATFVSYKFFLKIIPSRLPVIKTAEPLATRVLLAVAFAAPLYIATVLITHGSPLFMGVDRFNYFTYIAPPDIPGCTEISRCLASWSLYRHTRALFVIALVLSGLRSLSLFTSWQAKSFLDYFFLGFSSFCPSF